MNPVLILREEIVCLVLLLFFLVTACCYKTGRDGGSFLRLAVCAMGHVAFEILVILAMNPPGRVGDGVNRVFHACYHLFAVCYAYEFFCCTARIGLTQAAARRARRWALPTLLLFAAALPFLPLYYLPGDGIYYGMGPFIAASYLAAMLYFAASAAILFARRRSIPGHVQLALLPMLVAMMATVSLQWAVPELFFSGGALTAVTVGFFFALENPADVYRRKMQVDALTGVRSRHCYETDIRQVESSYRRDGTARYAVVFCDINNLKAVNNLYGHLEGDRYISAIAAILTREMPEARRIYRMGGDEFMALYRDTPEERVQREIQAVRRACEALGTEKEYPASVAMGCAFSDSGYRSIRDVLQVADYRMYRDKAQQKARQPLPDGRSNITGLTDPLFEAFARAAGEESCLFLYNVETGMARVSPGWVETFGLPGEFLPDFAGLWMDWLHPDDRVRYQQDTRDILTGRSGGRRQTYRARDREGRYVPCTCRSQRIRGRGGEPDLFVGVLSRESAPEETDPVTALPWDGALGPLTAELRARGEAALLLKLGVRDFSRVNILCGYAGGDRVLRQLAEELRARLPEGGRLFRAEGPRFVLLLSGGGREAAEMLYRDIRAAAGEGIPLPEQRVPLHLTGAALLLPGPGEGCSLRSLLAGGLEESRWRQGALVFCGGEEGLRLMARVHRDALGERQGFALRYQPVIRAESGAVAGAEALLYWRDGGGEVAPGRFLPWLEEDPCFFDLGLWILRRALRDGREMLALQPDFTLNVNVTAGQLQHPDFRRRVMELLAEEDFPPRRLCLELTERCRWLDAKRLAETAQGFRQEGIRLALDDVGMGAASFGLLLELPVQEVKLDRSFVGGIPWRQANRIFADAAVQAARRMGYDICFEGVESAETFDYLRCYGDVLCQGFYFDRPLPPETLLERLRAEGNAVGSPEI